MEEDLRLWIAFYQELVLWQVSMDLLVPNGELLGDWFFLGCVFLLYGKDVLTFQRIFYAFVIMVDKTIRVHDGRTS